jgi:hypothetical protein
MYKEAGERWDWFVDFIDNIDTGTTITSAVFLAIRESDGVDVTTDLAAAALTIIQPAATIVAQPVRAGDSGKTYMLGLTATRSDARAFIAKRRLIVRDTPPAVFVSV